MKSSTQKDTWLVLDANEKAEFYDKLIFRLSMNVREYQVKTQESVNTGKNISMKRKASRK